MSETPNIAASSYVSNTITAGDWLHRQVTPKPPMAAVLHQAAVGFDQTQLMQSIQGRPVAMTTRLVRVFLADPSDSVPLDQRTLWQGQEEWTELTDQELFFQLPIKELLDKHNVKRVTYDNKATKGRAVVEKLEAARIRDLTMTVVTIVQF